MKFSIVQKNIKIFPNSISSFFLALGLLSMLIWDRAFHSMVSPHDDTDEKIAMLVFWISNFCAFLTPIGVNYYAVTEKNYKEFKFALILLGLLSAYSFIVSAVFPFVNVLVEAIFGFSFDIIFLNPEAVIFFSIYFIAILFYSTATKHIALNFEKRNWMDLFLFFILFLTCGFVVFILNWAIIYFE